MGKKRILLDLAILALLLILYSVFRSGCDRWLIGLCLTVCAWEMVTIVIGFPKFRVRPVLIFLISFWIVNCQVYLDLLLGIVNSDLYVFGNSKLVNQGTMLSAIAFTAFAIGYKGTIDYEPKVKKTPSGYSTTINSFLVAFQLICFIWWLSSLTAADFSGVSYRNSGAYDKGNTLSGYAEVFFLTSQILSLSYYLKKENISNKFWSFISSVSWCVLATSGLYIAIRLMSGDRGGAIYTVFLFFFAYVYKTRKIVKLIPVLLAASLGAVIVTSIGLTRIDKIDLTFTERISYAVNNRDVIDSSLSPFTRELANSVHSTHVALVQTEKHRQPYMYGLFHLCYVLKFIPFLGNHIVYNVLGVPRIYQSSSEYLTVAYSGQHYKSGIGTTTIADDYLEFGVVGVIVGLLVIGFVFKKVDTCLLLADITRTPMSMIILTLVMCYGSLYIPRGIFFMFLRNWFYAIVVYGLVKSIIPKSR